jgi:thiamine biosynthesis protein ThiS
MQITVNGESREVEEGCSVASLLSDLGLKPERVAVELNLMIVDRQAFEQITLHQGDRIEVVGFIGGGIGPKR